MAHHFPIPEIEDSEQTVEQVELVANGQSYQADHPLVIPHDRIDPDALKVIHRLTRHGFLAYLVGGCVRDLLCGFTPKDFDVATSAWPGEVRDLFRNCRIIGRRFRLAHILFSGKFIEVSTFRGNAADAEAAEGDDLLIREDNVFGSPEEDARRRDFTLNALFYDVENHEIIDYVGGLEDIEGRMVRSIGDPQIRFREDPLRILRALRFAAKLDFQLEPEIHQAIADVRPDLVKSAPPRVHEELLKMLACGASARAFTLLQDASVLTVLMPGVAAAIEAAGEPIFKYLASLDQLDLGRRSCSDAVLLSALLYPLYLQQTGGEIDPYNWLEASRESSPLLMSTRRKDNDRMLQMFRAQKRFQREARGRRGSLGSFLRKDYFEDAYTLLRLGALATGANADLVAEWDERLASGPQARPLEIVAQPSNDESAPPPLQGEEGRPRGRRRRGRRFRQRD